MRAYRSTELFTALMAVFLAATSETAWPEPTVLGEPGRYQMTSSSVKLFGDAAAIESSVFRLTESSRQSGVVELPAVCAKEYVVSFELYPGSQTAGGAALFLHRTRESVGPLQRDGWGEVLIPPYTHDGLLNHMSDLVFDTFRDWWYENGQRVYQRDDNSVFWHAIDPVSGTSKKFLDEPIPFRMKGGGWFKVIHYQKGPTVQLQFEKAGTVVFDRTLPSFAEEGKAHHLLIKAFTGAATNDHFVKNIIFEGITSDYCPGVSPEPKLTREEVTTGIESSCGRLSGCPVDEGFEGCTSGLLSGLQADEKITDDDYSYVTSLVVQRIQYCTAFEDGIRSCDLENHKQAAYSSGFLDGVASVDTRSHYQRGYEEGYADGQASIPECPPVLPTPAATPTTTPLPEPHQLSKEEAQAVLGKRCPCETAVNHGAYVACVASLLRELLAGSAIDHVLKGDLQSEAARSACGKKRRRPAKSASLKAKKSRG